MKKLILPLAIAALLCSCSASKKTSGANNTPSQSVAEAAIQEGKSFETAIVIDDTHETSGVAKEYAWLREHYPGYKMIKQSLNYHKGKPYDILSITTAGGEKKDVYFDINKFFGKF